VGKVGAPKGVGGEQVEGRQAVHELLRAGRRRVKDVWIIDGADPSPILVEIEELATEARVPIRRVTRDQLYAAARCEAPQGVLAHAAELPEADLDDLLRPNRSGRPPFLLALDGVTDPQNLGALLRSAEGAGVTGIVLPRHRSVHVTPAVAKAAAGAIERLPIALVGGLPAALLGAKERGAWVIGLDADGRDTVYGLAHLATDPIILVLGAEGTGLSRLVGQRCDVLAAIPLQGALASLNVAAAGAIAMFELGRHRPVAAPTQAPDRSGG
jgi:23S rRNA (guanosine2251-2'-O)-methyltransferase